MKKSLILLSVLSMLFASCHNKKQESLPIDESDSESITETSEESTEITSSEETTEQESETESESETEIYSSSETEEYDPHAKYYESVDKTSSATMKSTLQKLMFNTHKTYTSYGDIRNLFTKSDADPNKSGNIICFYSHQSMNGKWDQGVTYNREHVWPKAKSAGLYPSTDNSYKGPGSDLHHVRPTKTDINEARGSQSFGYYIPQDDVKGDCARIIMYMYIHYASSCNSGVSSNYIGNLSITSVFNSINTLKQWNIEDPVDELEINRNEYCYTKQGNRNPFIDHPEWVNLVLG